MTEEIEVTYEEFFAFLKRRPDLNCYLVTICDPPHIEYYCKGVRVAHCKSDDRGPSFVSRPPYMILKGGGK